MAEQVEKQGIAALLQWNALLISFALFVTLAILGTITAKNDWTNIGILIVKKERRATQSAVILVA